MFIQCIISDFISLDTFFYRKKVDLDNILETRPGSGMSVPVTCPTTTVPAAEAED